MLKAIQHEVTITDFTIDHPALLEINHKMVTWGGGNSHLEKI
jgi:hypothetical protein